MAKILVTGSAGYIGSVLCRRLLEVGHSVVAVDTFRYGAQQATALAPLCLSPMFQLYRVDAGLTKVSRILANQADVVIPLAAVVGAPACDLDPAAATEINCNIIGDLVRNLRPNKRIIFPNTNSAYGSMPLGWNEPLEEDAPQLPVSHYARTKSDAEQRVLEHPGAVVFRLATVFGASPRMRVDLMVNDFVRRLMIDRYLALYQPEARRNFVHVLDVADAFLYAIAAHDHLTARGNRVFNLGNDDENCTKRELAIKIADRLGLPGAALRVVEGEDPDKRDYIVSSARLRERGFAASIGLDQGIDELAKLYCGFPAYPWGNI